MATGEEWALAYARQASADFRTFEAMQTMKVPQCHKLQFLQMACEKLAKSHLCGSKGFDVSKLRASHAWIAKHLPGIIRQRMAVLGYEPIRGLDIARQFKHLCQEIEILAPAIKRGGVRPDNCEYPWSDDKDKIHSPLDWTFQASNLLFVPRGRQFLKLVRGAIDDIL